MSEEKAISKNSFVQKVNQFVRKIPEGKVATYGQIAALAGKPLAARAVGNILHRHNVDVPCHRVVNFHGRLAPNFGLGGWKEQKRKLRVEGVPFKDELHVSNSAFIIHHSEFSK
jgi:methylated-DNA-protein-cysteine methyltransferase-like protein